MKNFAFIRNQTVKVVSEMKLLSSGTVESTAVVGVKDALNLADSQDFNHFKFGLLELVKEKSEPELREILAENRMLLCEDCRKNLDIFDIKCQKDLRRFMLCEYIMRSLV